MRALLNSPIFRYALICGATLISLALVAQYGVAWWAEARLNRKIAEIRAAGEPVELADLKRDPIPPESNAVTFLREARGGLEEFHRVLESLPDEDSKQFNRCRLTPKAKEELSAVLTNYPELFSQLDGATNCADFDIGFTLDVSDGYQTLNLSDAVLTRYASEALRYCALLYFADGNYDAALAISLSALRLARLEERTPTIVGFLLAFDCRRAGINLADLSLQAGPISADHFDQLDAELQRFDGIVGLRAAFVSERASSSTYFQEFYGKLRAGRYRRPILWVTKMNDYYSYLSSFDEPLRLIHRPYYEVTDLIVGPENARIGGVVTALLIPAFKASIVSTWQDIAMVRALRVLGAVKRYERAGHADELTLTDLGLPADVIVDPFSGEPLKMSKRADGWLIYSIGEDLKDEGGKINPRRDPGVGPCETWADEYDGEQNVGTANAE